MRTMKKGLSWLLMLSMILSLFAGMAMAASADPTTATPDPTPAEAFTLESGEIDLNSFQHKAYLQSEIDSQGYDIVAIGDTSSAPLTLYSKKVSSLDELKELAGPKEN